MNKDKSSISRFLAGFNLPKMDPAIHVSFNLLMRSVAVLAVSALLFQIANLAFDKQASQLRHGGVRLSTVESYNQIMFDSANFRDGKSIEEYLLEREEPPAVAYVKSAYPREFGGIYFEDLDGVFEFLKLSEQEELGARVGLFIVKNRMLGIDFDCSDVHSCVAPDTDGDIQSREARLSIDLVSIEVIPRVFQLLRSERYNEVNALIPSLMEVLQAIDFEVRDESDAQQKHSKALLVASFLSLNGRWLNPSITEDLWILFDTSVTNLNASEGIDDLAIKTYRNSIEEYYRGCFLDTVESLKEFRRLTSDEILNDLALIFSLRALTRPLVRSNDYISLSEKGEFRVSTCNVIVNLDAWHDRLQRFRGENFDRVSWPTLRDDIAYYDAIVESRLTDLENKRALYLSSQDSLGVGDEKTLTEISRYYDRPDSGFFAEAGRYKSIENLDSVVSNILDGEGLLGESKRYFVGEYFNRRILEIYDFSSYGSVQEFCAKLHGRGIECLPRRID